MDERDAIEEALHIKGYDDFRECFRKLQAQVDILRTRVVALEEDEDDGQ